MIYHRFLDFSQTFKNFLNYTDVPIGTHSI